MKVKKEAKYQYRFGIGEWYGHSFMHLTADQRRQYASAQLLPKEERPKETCPFLSRPGKSVACHKEGGICSLRSYQLSAATSEVTVDPRRSTIVTICPSRFEQDATIYPWINKTILPGYSAVPIGETPFLERTPKVGEDKATKRKAGRIDNILVAPESNPLQWIPVEKQAVYFSGRKMMLDFQNIATMEGEALPFPVIRRRPDYRSSSAKRLLPQLQTKVGILLGWAKKTAVLVDEDFFLQFGPMKEEEHISNAHLVWFVVEYVLQGSNFVLKPKFSRMVTLENSIRAVIAAEPIPQPKFEETLKGKLEARLKPPQT